MSPERLHYLLIHHIIDRGHAPDLRRLAELAGCSEQETANGLGELEQMHGVVLEPDSTRVWSAHPFALLPTGFWVSAGGRGWWANCAWCALGIGAALGEDVTISTCEGGEAARLEFRVESGRASRQDVWMHFPYPPARWWENPYCPCGNILFFTSDAAIDAWCARHARPKGAVLDIQQGIALSERWFGDYASPGWRRKTPAELASIFAGLGLDPIFWTIPPAFR
jgi:hypothetical protein